MRDREKTLATRRRANIKARYGITESDFRKMVADQGGVCAACGTADWGPKGPCIDHDHQTGAVRGILCFSCNTVLGHVSDSVSRLSQLIDYLE